MATTRNDARRHALECMVDSLRIDDFTAAEWEWKHPRLRFLGRTVSLFWSIVSAIRCIPCLITGEHDLVDEGYANPECGCISIGCRRCGYYYPTHWLY